MQRTLPSRRGLPLGATVRNGRRRRRLPGSPDPGYAQPVSSDRSAEVADFMPAQDGKFLDIRRVAMRYETSRGTVEALGEVNLTFDAGSFVCVVGPSGCGKTTLLQILGGFVKQSSGEVFLNGNPLGEPSKERGMVFQQPALFHWMNVYRNAEFGPRVTNVSKKVRQERVERYLKLVGLWEFRNSYPYHLSGGMQQRLAIVRALVNEPEILLADEPFGALDAFTREQMQEELHAVWRATKMTVMLVTHSVEEAVFLGTHVVVMSHRPGRVLELVEPPFSRQADRGNGRAIKASAEFVKTREQVLSRILSDSGMRSPEPSLPGLES
jgi:ABC-type taurine transport system ATPase subunit